MGKDECTRSASRERIGMTHATGPSMALGITPASAAAHSHGANGSGGDPNGGKPAGEITAAVTDAPNQGLTVPSDDGLEIPKFLLRNADGSFTFPGALAGDVSASGPEPATGDGGASVAQSQSDDVAPPEPEPTDEFARFRVDPSEIETAIQQEADRRWRNWTPTKGEAKLTRPQKRAFVRDVRAEFRKAGKC